MRHRPLLLPSALVCGSLVWLRGFDIDGPTATLALCGLLATATLAAKRSAHVVSLVCSCLTLSTCAAFLAVPRIPAVPAHLLENMPMRIEGVVLRVLRQSPERVTYVMGGHHDARPLPCIRTTSLCYEHAPTDQIQSGQYRIATGYGRLPSPVTLPDEVDEQAIAHQLGVSYMVESAQSNLTHDASAIDMLRHQVRSSTVVLFDRALSETARGVARALVLGDRTAIDQDRMKRYQRTGTAHMFSVSGSHIGLVFVLVLLLLYRWRGGTVVFATAILVLVFVYITGAEPPAVRAAVMGLAVVLARWREWTIDGLNLLAGTVLILALYDPWTIDTASTVLSVSAVCGIIVLTPIWSRYARVIIPASWRTAHRLIPTFGVSIAASTAVLIPTLVYFENVAVYSVISNLFVVPILSLVFMLAPLLVVTTFLGVQHPVASMIEVLVHVTDQLLLLAITLEDVVRHDDARWIMGALSVAAWWWPLCAYSVLGAGMRGLVVSIAIVSMQLIPRSDRMHLWVYERPHRMIVGVTTTDTTRMIAIGSTAHRLDQKILAWSRARREQIRIEGIGRWGRRMAARIQHDIVGSKHADTTSLPSK